MFEVGVKNVTEKQGREGRGPARVWGSDKQWYFGRRKHFKTYIVYPFYSTTYNWKEKSVLIFYV